MPFSSLLCWNVAGRVARMEHQQQRIVELAPDLICLQEIRAGTLAAWTRRLAESGWGFALAADPQAALAAGRSRPLLTFTAARVPLEPTALIDLPWPERALAVRVEGLELLNVHSPTSPKPGLAKVLTHELLAAHLAGGSGPRVLCGDLNTPRKEHPDGSVWTLAAATDSTI